LQIDLFILTPNGLRYPLVDGTRQRHFDGTNLKPRKLPENAQSPTSRVHAVLGGNPLRFINLFRPSPDTLQDFGLLQVVNQPNPRLNKN